MNSTIERSAIVSQLISDAEVVKRQRDELLAPLIYVQKQVESGQDIYESDRRSD